MMDLITDRTFEDVTTGTAKGSYRASDLNRVGEAVQYISDVFRTCGYIVDTAPKTDWTDEDIPSPAQLQRYVDDIAVLRGLVAVSQATPTPPTSMEYLSYTDANDIEKILVDIDDSIRRLKLSQFYSNEIFCGEI